jgi:hypothetical protein
MSLKKKIDIRYGSLFPWPFQFIAGIVLILVATLIVERTIVAIAFMIFSGLVITASEGTEIDLSNNTFLEYKSFFFIKSGTIEKFNGMEKIFINASKTKQRLYTPYTTKSSLYENIVYNAFLKFDDGTKVHLMQKKKKALLMKRLDKIAADLGVPVEDQTVNR